jgi:hypothetical protein
MGHPHRKELLADFGNNFHVRHKAVFEKDKDRLILVKGGPGSRIFKKAIRISEEGKNGWASRLKYCPLKCKSILGPSLP